MKITWQAEDIVPGRVVGKPDRTERWMIGYLAAESGKRRYVLISMSDGMVNEPATADALAIDLNKAGEMPMEFLDSPQAKGGRARAASMTRAQRKEQASAAANARWNGSP